MREVSRSAVVRGNLRWFDDCNDARPLVALSPLAAEITDPAPLHSPLARSLLVSLLAHGPARRQPS